MTVRADVDGIVIDGAALPVDRPLQRIRRDGGRNAQTIADARLDFRCFLVVIPRHQLQAGQLLPRVVESIDLREGLQPRLPALLAHDAIRAP